MLVAKSSVQMIDNRYYQKKKKFLRKYDQVYNPQYNVPTFDLRLIIARHAERLDTTFGDQWYSQVFGTQIPAPRERYFNPVLPQPLPYRSNTLLYEFDPPITRRGQMSSFAKGQQLRGVVPSVDYCYASPASRCVITASAILQGMNQSNVRIRLEPSLFEPLTWNTHFQQLPGISPFLATSSWIKTGYNIDRKYPHLIEDLSSLETENDFYERSGMFFQEIVRKHGRGTPPMGYGFPNSHTPTVLMVGHAASPIIYSIITQNQEFNAEQFGRACNRVQFLDGVVLERLAKTHIWRARPVMSF